jgi:GST-like protein
MNFPADFPITKKWPAKFPERIQLYSLPTPNGVKASTMLEECGLPYEPHTVSFDRNDQFSPEFLSLNPNNKIPAIIDPLGPGGRPLPLFESGAILIYLAEKAGRFLPTEAARRYQCLQWLMFQVGGTGPMFGQLGFFHKFAGKECEEYSIADIAIFPGVNTLISYYGAGELVGFAEYANVQRALSAFLARPAVQRGLKIPDRNG